MTTKNTGGPAFPLPVDAQECAPRFESGYGGMSLLDAMAIAALQGLCANPGGPYQQSDTCGWSTTNCNVDDIASVAYSLAEAMLAARAKEPA